MITQKIIKLAYIVLKTLNLKPIIVISLVLAFSLSCSLKNDNIANDIKWARYFDEIGVPNINLKNHVILVLNSVECAPAIEELLWWDKKSENVNVKMVIISKYQNEFQSVLQTNKLTIESYRDSIGEIYNLDLISTTPAKVFINSEGKIHSIRPIGEELNTQALKEFLQKPD